MKKLLWTLLILGFSYPVLAQDQEKTVSKLMDAWHAAAAKADFEGYFKLMDTASVFIGTDATERWTKPAFMAYARPHFAKGKAWSFTALERNIIFSADGKTAWLDELLDTQMKLCRGAAVLELQQGRWLIKQYVLSMCVPNEVSSEVIQLKSALENKVIDSIKEKE